MLQSANGCVRVRSLVRGHLLLKRLWQDFGETTTLAKADSPAKIIIIIFEYLSMSGLSTCIVLLSTLSYLSAYV